MNGLGKGRLNNLAKRRLDPLAKRRWGCHFSDAEIAAARDQGRLLTMEIETSHACNLRCVYCYNSSGRRAPGELTFSELCGAIDQAAGLGARRIIIIGGGEPLLYPEFQALVTYLDKKGLGIDLFTNGTLLSTDLARFLYDHAVQPVVKLNSLDPAVQDELAAQAGTFAAIQRGLEHLVRAGYPGPGRELGIESIICARNLGELPALWRWARERGIIPYFEMITFQGRAQRHHDLNVTVGELESLFAELARIDLKDYGHAWPAHPPLAALACSRHEYSCTLTATGDIQPCTGVDIRVGNIRQAPLRQILAQSPVITDLRRIRQTIKGACRTCDLLAGCYGCRGMAYHQTGDYLAADPLCWRNPCHLGAPAGAAPAVKEEEGASC